MLISCSLVSPAIPFEIIFSCFDFQVMENFDWESAETLLQAIYVWHVTFVAY